MTNETMTWLIWFDAMITHANKPYGRRGRIVSVQVADLDRDLGGKTLRERAAMYWRDGVSYEMAADTLREMTRQLVIAERGDREESGLRAMLAGVRASAVKS